VAGQGLDIVIDFLEPNQTYTLTIWSYDNVNNGRLSDWSANGATLTNGYAFNGSTLPTNNSTYRFTFPVTADSVGKVLIQGRRNSGATAANNVFINALQVTQVQGELRVQRIELTTTNTLRLIFSAINSANTHRIEQITNVTDTVWTDVPEAVFSPPSGNTVEAILPVPATSTRFYRVVETPGP
jgi:hypothetical protein